MTILLKSALRMFKRWLCREMKAQRANEGLLYTNCVYYDKNGESRITYYSGNYLGEVSKQVTYSGAMSARSR